MVGGIENDCGGRLHGVFDVEDTLFALFFERGEDKAVLTSQQVEDWGGLENAGDDVGDGVGDDDRKNDGVVAGDFEDHEDGSHGDAEKGGEEDAHADEAVGAGGAGEVREEMCSMRPMEPPSMAPIIRWGRTCRRGPLT